MSLDEYPSGKGFPGVIGDTGQWDPDLVYDSHEVGPPRTPAGC
jgi:arylsulfatase